MNSALRERFANEVLEAIHGAVPNATLGIRISALDGSVDGTGLDLDKTYEIVKRLRLDPLDFIESVPRRRMHRNDRSTWVCQVPSHSSDGTPPATGVA
jgi:2,4-dienoyl-CoA reductase-like NADH-dependent reductase (Old Yellow Enzyme family)